MAKSVEQRVVDLEAHALLEPGIEGIVVRWPTGEFASAESTALAAKWEAEGREVPRVVLTWPPHGIEVAGEGD